jgi:cell division protein FtsL
MKSAYELAMERLSKSDPQASKALSRAQRDRLSEIDKVFLGKIAEREIFLKQRLEQALTGRDAGEVDKIRKQIASERVRLEEEREAEKDAVRSGKP